MRYVEHTCSGAVPYNAILRFLNKFRDSSKKHLQSAYLYDTIIFAFEYIDCEQSF